jgi:DNA recombination protein RmuC
MIIAIAIICAALGIAIGYLLGHGAKTEVAVLRSQLATEIQKNAELKENSAKQLEIAKSEAAQSLEIAKRDMERVHQSSLNEQKARFDDISKRLVAEAKNATEEMLKQREKQISESGHATMEQIVNPLKETIAKMEKTMNDTTRAQTEANSSLKEVLKQSIDANDKTKNAASELVRAFKHDSKIQGDWGERVLEEVLESLGLEEGKHFDVQTTLRDANGITLRADGTNSMLRPDVIVHLDPYKEVIVDSKVSMTAFMDYIQAEDPDERKELLKKHIESLRKHVNELSTKDYSSYVKAPKKTMDFVVMFVPRAAALWAALAEDHSLWRDAFEKNVYIADEQSLYAMLRMVKMTWRQVQQAQNQQRVFELANEMLKRVGMFVKNMEEIGAALGKAQEAYGKGVARLGDRGQSIVTTCRKLERLGARQDSKNPLPNELDGIEMQTIEDDV